MASKRASIFNNSQEDEHLDYAFGIIQDTVFAKVKQMEEEKQLLISKLNDNYNTLQNQTVRMNGLNGDLEQIQGAIQEVDQRNSDMIKLLQFGHNGVQDQRSLVAKILQTLEQDVMAALGENEIPPAANDVEHRARDRQKDCNDRGISSERKLNHGIANVDIPADFMSKIDKYQPSAYRRSSILGASNLGASNLGASSRSMTRQHMMRSDATFNSPALDASTAYRGLADSHATSAFEATASIPGGYRGAASSRDYDPGLPQGREYGAPGRDYGEFGTSYHAGGGALPYGTSRAMMAGGSSMDRTNLADSSLGLAADPAGMPPRNSPQLQAMLGMTQDVEMESTLVDHRAFWRAVSQRTNTQVMSKILHFLRLLNNHQLSLHDCHTQVNHLLGHNTDLYQWYLRLMN